MQLNEFKTYHPIVNFTYFVFVIGFSMFFMHPVCLAISLTCGFLYSVIIKGTKAIKANLFFIISVVLGMTIINPLFNHEGITIITYLPNGNPFTLEAAVYGFASAVMIASVICYFSCYSGVMTEDKFIYLFGRVMPSMSLLLSMTLRFIPSFKQEFINVKNAQKCIGCDISQGGVIKRMKIAAAIILIMISHSLENAIHTADSMKARGYGLKGRGSFSVFRFDARDKKAIVFILIFGLYVLAGGIKGEMSFGYFPSIKGVEYSIYSLSVFVAYFMLCMMPIIIELWEVMRWKSIKSRI